MTFQDQLQRTIQALWDFRRELVTLQEMLPRQVPEEQRKALDFLQSLGITKVQRALDAFLEKKD